MSARIREAIAALEDDTAALNLAPPERVRARGERLRRRRTAGGVALVAVLTVATVSAGVAATNNGGTDASPPVGTGATVNCGDHVLGLMDRIPEAAITCFLDAVEAHRPARLAVTSPTTEGDPIPTLYVVGEDGTVEVTTDFRQDRFGGGQGLVLERCTGPEATNGRIMFRQCSSPVRR
ncbi:DUF4362 domain-containing protein [Micromonospora chalcea]|uniref:DUF4362 domain-containing protein n=1 Tax=Micromonospora chalcea TaxID=1874 RepID=UPI0037A4FD31